MKNLVKSKHLMFFSVSVSVLNHAFMYKKHLYKPSPLLRHAVKEDEVRSLWTSNFLRTHKSETLVSLNVLCSEYNISNL